MYADKQLGLDQSVQLQTILLVQFLAFGGALLLGRLAKRFGAWKTVLGSLVLWTVVVGIAYFLPGAQRVAGVVAPAPNAALYFMLLGALLGIVLGGSQALSRSLFSQLIPKGKEGEYFGLYEISDKGTSWLGPLLFGLTYQATQRYRRGDHLADRLLRDRVRGAAGDPDPSRHRGRRQRPPARPLTHLAVGDG